MTRIALLGPGHPFRGGISYFTHHLADRLAAEPGIELDYGVFSRQYPKLLFPGAGDRREESSLARLRPADFRWDPWSPRGIREAARRAAAADVVLIPWWTWFWGATDLLLLRELRRAGARRVVAIVHNFSDHEDSVGKRALSQAVLSRCDAFLAHSKAIAEPLRRAFPGKPVALANLPLHELPGDRDLPRADARALLGLPPDRPVLLFFGFVRPYKGLEDLVAAWPAIRRETEGTLVIAGEAWKGGKALLESAARLPGVVTVPRYLDDAEIAPWFRAADLVVLPYRSATGSGIVPIAAWFGRAVLATAVPGIEEVVVDGKTGTLVPAGDSAALATRAVALLRGAELDRMGEAARSHGGEAFSWRRYVGRIAEIADSAPPRGR